jgi:two-component system nitrogen regulation sensor histidine kinase NtrY
MLGYFKKKYVNSTLSRKITLLITVFVTVIPMTLVVGFAVAYYKVGIQALFNEQIRKSIGQTVEIAERYLKEHKENIKSDALALANDVERNFPILHEDPELFRVFIDKQAELRNLSEIVVFHREKILARNSFAFSFAFEKLPDAALKEADEGQVIILNNPAGVDKVRAILRLDDVMPVYLLVGRYVDQSILDYLHNTQGSAMVYNSMLADLNLTQFRLAVFFVVLLATVCILSLFAGKKLAFFITRPLNELVEATMKLKSGDFSYQIPERPGKDETAVLTRAFNIMTLTLAKNRNELMRFNQIIDERRQFIEKIVSGVSAGVIALDATNHIVLINDFARSLLKYSQEVESHNLQDIMPEIAPLVESAKNTPVEMTQEQIKVVRDGVIRYLLIRVGVLLAHDDAETIETVNYRQERKTKKPKSRNTAKTGDEIRYVIITVDDITELMAAQRSAAWADVARRIAHEIKNPLTPISLATERIKTKYSQQIVHDKANFERYITTIAKYVQDIGNIVEEFVRFARIPSPTFKLCNLSRLIKEVIFSQNLVNSSIKYNLEDDFNGECIVSCDATQISQVILNTLKNAIESIEQKQAGHPRQYTGQILIQLIKLADNYVQVMVKDNGAGIDYDVLDKVFDPYVTTKTKGTGLGLAIVRKIVEDHSGSISLKPLAEGAEVKFTLPLIRGVENEQKL